MYVYVCARARKVCFIILVRERAGVIKPLGDTINTHAREERENPGRAFPHSRLFAYLGRIVRPGFFTYSISFSLSLSSRDLLKESEYKEERIYCNLAGVMKRPRHALGALSILRNCREREKSRERMNESDKKKFQSNRGAGVFPLLRAALLTVFSLEIAFVILELRQRN